MVFASVAVDAMPEIPVNGCVLVIPDPGVVSPGSTPLILFYFYLFYL